MKGRWEFSIPPTVDSLKCGLTLKAAERLRLATESLSCRQTNSHLKMKKQGHSEAGNLNGCVSLPGATGFVCMVMCLCLYQFAGHTSHSSLPLTRADLGKPAHASEVVSSDLRHSWFPNLCPHGPLRLPTARVEAGVSVREPVKDNQRRQKETTTASSPSGHMWTAQG